MKTYFVLLCFCIFIIDPRLEAGNGMADWPDPALFDGIGVRPETLPSPSSDESSRARPVDLAGVVVCYDVIIRNWTPHYLQVNPFALTDGTNPEWVEFLHAVIPYGETDSICYDTLPDFAHRKMNWLFGTEPFTLGNGKSSISISHSPSQVISLHMPPLIQDQPWMLDGLVFNFSEADVWVSYQLRIRGQILEFLPSGKLWDGETLLPEHSLNLDEIRNGAPVDNPFLLHGKEQSYGIALVNVTDQVLSVNDFPAWSLVPGRSWTDSPHNVNLPPYGRVTSWTIREPSEEKSIEVNWKILDWQDGGAKIKVIRAAQQILALSDFEKIRRANELYTINLVWDGSSFQLTYTVVRDGTLIDLLPDMSVAPKSMMESQCEITSYHRRE